MKVFISHWTAEKSLAKGLANWIDERVGMGTCFCSSRPTDLVPGHEWFHRIRAEAIGADVALFMISPDSANREWIYYEAGLVSGSGAIGG